MSRIKISEGENGLRAFPDTADQLVASSCINTIINWSADTVTVINCGSIQGDFLCSEELKYGISPIVLLLSYEQLPVRRQSVADAYHLLFLLLVWGFVHLVGL